MTPEAFRALALSFPGTHEEPHFERRSFRVGKKIFATLAPDGAEGMVKLPVPEDAEALADSRGELFFSHGAWTTRLGALGVRLARARATELGPLMEAAWRGVAPKRLVSPKASDPRSAPGKRPAGSRRKRLPAR